MITVFSKIGKANLIFVRNPKLLEIKNEKKKLQYLKNMKNIDAIF